MDSCPAWATIMDHNPLAPRLKALAVSVATHRLMKEAS